MYSTSRAKTNSLCVYAHLINKSDFDSNNSLVTMITVAINHHSSKVNNFFFVHIFFCSSVLTLHEPTVLHFMFILFKPDMQTFRFMCVYVIMVFLPASPDPTPPPLVPIDSLPRDVRRAAFKGIFFQISVH